MSHSSAVAARLTRRRSPWVPLVVGAVLGVAGGATALWATAPSTPVGPQVETTVDPVVIPGAAPTLPNASELVEVPADPSDPLRSFTDCTGEYLARNGYDDVTRLQGIDSPGALRLIDDAQVACGAVKPDG